ncbi:MAG: LCP family protein [Propioniciclava sp.]|uniref:LCP family protein n=1 Tax=Propioniciclava sp. TaxID=2038686 RepID=UPI0039E6D38C
MGVPAQDADEPTRRKRGFATWFFAIVGGLVALGLIASGFYVWRVWSTVNEFERSDTLLPTASGRPPAEASAAGSLNFVLMGSDARSDDEQGRSDVLMLAHVPPARDHVYLVSFPRDMWVDVPGRGYAKINAAYAWGGDQLVISTLESMLDVRADHAVKIDFDGFIGLTTALGGVTLDNRVASSAERGRYWWPRGEITIQGEEALRYVRQRKELPGGDLDRAERQRAVAKAILVKAMSADVLANPLAFNDFMGKVGRYVTLDSGLTNDALFSIATSMRLTSSADIRILQAPLGGFSTSSDGQAIDLVNEEQLGELAQAIRAGSMGDYYDRYKNQPFAGR